MMLVAVFAAAVTGAAKAHGELIPVGTLPPGPNDAITDVAGVRVGQVTKIEGAPGPLVPGVGPVRTGVTVVLPNDDPWTKRVAAATFDLNGNGELTGAHWVDEAGFLEVPIALTNTLDVGRVDDGVVDWTIRKHPGIGVDDDVPLPVVAECDDQGLNDIQGRHVRPQDVVTAQVKYDRLDRAGNAVRIRLSSTVVQVKHVGEMATATEVEVSYSQQGKLKTVRASHCILACWHTMIPYIASELPDAQVAALRSSEKVPIVYTNVALRNWQAFVKLKAGSTYAPGNYFTNVNLDQRVSIGDYHATTRPEQPIVLTMHRFPCKPGLPARSQHRAGRAQLYGTPFAVFERNIREQLARSLGSGGFDPANDIAAITVNRWPHGYAYQYNSLWDPFWLDGGPQPCVAARQPFGRIAIANADADAYAYTDCAIDQAYRAVGELKVGVKS